MQYHIQRESYRNKRIFCFDIIPLKRNPLVNLSLELVKLIFYFPFLTNSKDLFFGDEKIK